MNTEQHGQDVSNAVFIGEIRVQQLGCGGRPRYELCVKFVAGIRLWLS